jgi:hypothetical protein
MPATSSNSEVIAQLRRKLLGYMEQAAEAVKPVEEAPGSAKRLLGYARYLVGIRRRLRTVASELHGSSPDVQDRLMRQAEISFLTHQDRFSNIEGRAALLEAWTGVLVEAGEKLEADRRRAERYAEVAAEVDEPTAVGSMSTAVMGSWHTE